MGGCSDTTNSFLAKDMLATFPSPDAEGRGPEASFLMATAAWTAAGENFGLLATLVLLSGVIAVGLGSGQSAAGFGGGFLMAPAAVGADCVALPRA